jgi:hypothetical protein
MTIQSVLETAWKESRVKHFRDGNTWRSRSDAPWSTENCCNWVQQAKSGRAHQTRSKDNSQRNCSTAWSGAPCGPGDVDSGISKIYSRWIRLLTSTEEKKRLDTALPSTLKSGFGPPQTNTCLDSWKITWEVTITRLTRQFRKPCEAGCEELERTCTAEAFLRFCNAGRNA